MPIKTAYELYLIENWVCDCDRCYLALCEHRGYGRRLPIEAGGQGECYNLQRINSDPAERKRLKQAHHFIKMTYDEDYIPF